MDRSRCVTARGRVSVFGAVAALLLLTGTAFSKSVNTTVTNLAIDKTSIQAGQTVQVTYTLSGPVPDPGLTVALIQNGTAVKPQTFAPSAPEAQPGTHTLLLDTNGLANGSYSVRITTPDSSLSDYTNIANTADPNLHFSNPRGVAVNTVTGSPDLGRIYVTEGGGGTVTGRTTVNGLYILNPDLTPAFPNPKATNTDLHDAGYPDDWSTATNSPFRVTVGPDNKVYITDWSDTHNGLFETDADGNNLKALLYFPEGVHSNPNSNNNTGGQMYGSISSVWVQGTGANRTLFTTDEDLSPGNSVWKYVIPDGTYDNNIDPQLVIDGTGVLTNSYEDMVRDGQGSFYVVSTVANEAYKYDSNGLQQVKLPDTGLGYYGIAINDTLNKIALASTGGHIFVTDKNFANATDITIGSGTHRDIALDADGWIYTVNSGDEQLYVIAPPGTAIKGANVTASQTLSVVSPLPGDIAPVGPNGLFLGPNGQRYGDGKVDIKDAAYALRVAAGLNTIP